MATMPIENAQEPEILWHYTSLQTFVTIVTHPDGVILRASRLTHVNDATELRHGFDLATKMLGEELAEHGIDATTMEIEQHAFANTMRKRLSEHAVYAACFSTDGNHLGQWRAYCPPGAGYAIGFSREALTTWVSNHHVATVSPGVELHECQYTEDRQRALLREYAVTEAEVVAIRRGHKERPGAAHHLFRGAEMMRTEFVRSMGVIKHLCFADEHEWRLLNFRGGDNPSYTYDETLIRRGLFRAASSMVVPYNEFLFGEKPELIKRVMIGPTTHPDQARQSANMLLARHGFAPCAEYCDLPFRHLV
jgi:hypothetical protein